MLASPAEAHALLRRSNPAAGEILQQAPKRVLITFTEPPDPGLSVVHVLDANGHQVGRGPVEQIPGAPAELMLPLGAIPDGVYTVTWRVVSRADGHVTAGSFSFGVGVASVGVPISAGGAAPGTPSPSPPAVAGRWAFYWGLALLMGAGVVGTVVVPGLPAGGRRLLVGSWLLGAAGLVIMTVAERSTVDVPLAQLLRSSAGRQFEYRGIALLILGGITAVAIGRSRRAWLGAIAVAAAAAMLVHVLAGHAGAVTPAGPRWFDVIVQWLHVLAVGVWVGGLAWLLLAVRTETATGRARAAKRFSFVAGVGLAVVAVTGSVRAASELGGVHALRGLFHTSFGLTLLVKVALFGGLVALGARNRYVNIPNTETSVRAVGSLRRTVQAEILVAAGIMGATGVLSELPPATTIAAAAAATRAIPQRVVVAGSDFATSVRVRLAVTPGTVGPNAFSARVTDYDTGRPVSARAVGLTFTLPGRPDVGSPSLPLARGDGGVWIGRGTVISLDGTWNISVLVQEPSTAVEVPLRFTPRLPPESIQVSKAPGQPTVYTIALAGGASLQTYVDPGSPGNNTVHFTFFQRSGSELPIRSATGSAVTPGGVPENLPLVRFDSGHFVANTRLDSGRWRFHVQASTKEGGEFNAYFEQPIPS
jgi:copper transport protein